jgi:hypothetical protein
VRCATTAGKVLEQNLTNSQTKTLPPVAARPVWLSTAGYFLIAAAASIGLFFVLWILLHDEGERDSPWISAGIAACVMFGAAVVAREVVLRRARNRYLLHQVYQNGFAVPPAYRQKGRTKSDKKFTLEKNAAALRLIQQKAGEAETALATAQMHAEVFRACQEYLEIVARELREIQIGSPRLPALRNGQEMAKNLHKHHLLRWASEEAKQFMREANVLVSLDEKVETAQRALDALAFAMQFYPNEPQLHDSAGAVREFIVSVRVSHWIELAERETFKGHFRKAIDHYKDALFYLSRETSLGERELDLMAARINGEIEKLNAVAEQKKLSRRRRSLEK